MLTSHLYGKYDMMKQMGEARAKSINYEDLLEEIPTAYTESLKFFMGKNVITKPEFLKLEKKVRKYAFTVAKQDSIKSLGKIKKNLFDTLEGIDPFTGEKLKHAMLNIEDWLQTIDKYFDINGISKLAQWHLRLVFHVNVQTALNEGRMAMLQESDPEEFPFIEYVAILDERTRPGHRALNGFKAPANDPIWQKITPPLGFRCRCGIRPVHVDEELEASASVPDTSGRGFEFVN